MSSGKTEELKFQEMMEVIRTNIGGKWKLYSSENMEEALREMDRHSEIPKDMGSGSVLEEIQSKIGGKWELNRSDNFEAALEAMGLNIVFRKLASHSKPSMEILVEEDKVKIIAKASFFTQTMVLPLDQPYEEEFEGIKMNCTTKWENNKLITEANPVEPSKHKSQKFHRERINDELVQTMWIGDVVCTRVFKQQT